MHVVPSTGGQLLLVDATDMVKLLVLPVCAVCNLLTCSRQACHQQQADSDICCGTHGWRRSRPACKHRRFVNNSSWFASARRSRQALAIHEATSCLPSCCRQLLRRTSWLLLPLRRWRPGTTTMPTFRKALRGLTWLCVYLIDMGRCFA